MSHRLNIELTDEDKVLCSCYWFDAAHTDTALDLTEAIIRSYDDIFGGSGADLYIATKLFESMGGGIIGVERERLHREFGKVLEIAPARSVYDGIINVTETGIRETRRWESARVRIDLTRRSVDFYVYEHTYMEDYIDFCDRVPGCIPWNELPRIDAGSDIFTGVYFDRLDMVRRIMEKCPDGFRLSSGDVVEWM